MISLIESRYLVTLIFYFFFTFKLFLIRNIVRLDYGLTSVCKGGCLEQKKN